MIAAPGVVGMPPPFLGERMKAFIEALNSVNSQVWAFFMLCAGGVMVVVFHRNGIAIDIAAGVIGAAVQLFQTSNKVQVPDSKPIITAPETPAPNPTQVTK